MAKAGRSGDFHAASEALRHMRVRLKKRMEVQQRAKGTTGAKR